MIQNTNPNARPMQVPQASPNRGYTRPVSQRDISKRDIPPPQGYAPPSSYGGESYSRTPQSSYGGESNSTMPQSSPFGPPVLPSTGSSRGTPMMATYQTLPSSPLPTNQSPMLQRQQQLPTYTKESAWRFNMLHPRSPKQCCCGMFCPWIMTLEMIANAAPFELAGLGCTVTRESAMFLTLVAWLLWFSSCGLFFLLIMVSIATGIKKRLSIKEHLLQTTLKICCCLSCFQIQMRRQCEEVGLPIGVKEAP